VDVCGSASQTAVRWFVLRTVLRTSSVKEERHCELYCETRCCSVSDSCRDCHHPASMSPSWLKFYSLTAINVLVIESWLIVTLPVSSLFVVTCWVSHHRPITVMGSIHVQVWIFHLCLSFTLYPCRWLIYGIVWAVFQSISYNKGVCFFIQLDTK